MLTADGLLSRGQATLGCEEYQCSCGKEIGKCTFHLAERVPRRERRLK